MRALVLGGYGFIGVEIARRLAAAGHDVTCVGRSAETGRQLFPTGKWLASDIATLTSQGDWRDHIAGIDVVINASGALQSGLRDDPEAIHHTAIAALIEACEAGGPARFIQISAVGAATGATTEFLRSKARGDVCLRFSRLNWVIIRPGLVIGSNAYGGTALLRVIASVPLIQPIMYGDSIVQTVAMSDVTAVVLDAVEGRLPSRVEFDLVEDEGHTLQVILEKLREWLGLAPARMCFVVPEWLASISAKVADGLGHLGWRSPLRSTTMRVLADNVVGNLEEFRKISDRKLSSFSYTISQMPSTLQERWFARLYLLLPVVVAILAAFWILTGLIALAQLDSAMILTGLKPDWGRAVAATGALIDVALGTMILYRPWARNACWGMIAVSLAYLAAGSVLRPDLWVDPLGPLLKIIPVMALALIAAALVEHRR